MRITPGQNKRMHGLLSSLGLDKYEIISMYIPREVKSSSDLSFHEAQVIITTLEKLSKGSGLEARDEADVKRKRIISSLREMGAETEAGKADMKFIYEWIEKQFNQHLNSMNVAELSAVIGVIDRKIKPWFYQKLETNKHFSIKP